MEWHSHGWVPFTQIYTISLRGCHSSKHFHKFCSSKHLQIQYGVGATWVPSSLTLFTGKQPREWSGRVAYLTLLADMTPTLGKINETEPTSTNRPDIPGFEVSMYLLFQYDEGPVPTHILGICRNHVSSEQFTSASLLLLTALERWALPIDWEYLHINQGWEHLHDCP